METDRSSEAGLSNSPLAMLAAEGEDDDAPIDLDLDRFLDSE